MNVCNTHKWTQLIRMSSRKNPYILDEVELGDTFRFDFLRDFRDSPPIQRKKACTSNDFLLSQVVYLQFKRETVGILD